MSLYKDSILPRSNESCGKMSEINFSRDSQCIYIKFEKYPRWIPHTKASDAALWCVFICAWIYDWANNHEADDLRRNRVHYDVTVMNYPPVTVKPYRRIWIKLRHYPTTTRHNKQRIVRIRPWIYTTIWGLVCKKQMSRAGASAYTPLILWDVISRVMLTCVSETGTRVREIT